MKSFLPSLLLCALATAASSVQAMYLNPSGTGEVLLFPYYTVNAGQSTVISLSNTTDRVKFVDIQFREGYNSREVLRLSIVLGPHDSWTGTAAAGVQGEGARLVTRDESCTLPDKDRWTGPAPGGGFQQVFYAFAYTNRYVDGGPTTDARTREGYVEVIERAEFSGALAAAVIGQHPPRCTVMQQISPQSPDISAPTGGLSGTFSIVDVADGTLFAGTATAVADFSAEALLSDFPADYAWITHGQSRAGPRPETDAIVAVDGRLARLTYATATQGRDHGANALSALLMTESLSGDFNREAALGTHSEWVITAPTKFLHTDDRTDTQGLAPFAQLAPFNSTFDSVERGASCVPYAAVAYDREGRAITFMQDTTPVGALPPQSLCFATNVVHFSPLAADGGTPLLGSRLGSRLSLPATEAEAGSVRLDLGVRPGSNGRNTLPAGVSGPTLRGLPVIGFEVVRYVNNNVTPGVLSNYSAATPLRGKVRCSDANGVAKDCP